MESVIIILFIFGLSTLLCMLSPRHDESELDEHLKNILYVATALIAIPLAIVEFMNLYLHKGISWIRKKLGGTDNGKLT